MSRKKSKYRPRQVLTDPLAWVLNGLKPLTTAKDEYIKLCTKNHGAMTAMAQGTGSRGDVDVLIAALNMTEALYLVRERLGSDWKDEIKAAQDALLSMARRGVARGNRFLFTGLELQAVNLGLEVHDAQLSACSIGQLEEALRLVIKMQATGKARLIFPKEMATC